MPTIRLAEETKKNLEDLMADRIRKKIDSVTGKKKTELFLQLTQRKFGLTYNDFVKELIELYTLYTK